MGSIWIFAVLIIAGFADIINEDFQETRIRISNNHLQEIRIEARADSIAAITHCPRKYVNK